MIWLVEPEPGRKRGRLIFARRSGDYTLRAQCFNLGTGIIRLAQHLVAVLADMRGWARVHLFLSCDPERAVDGQTAAINKRYQSLASKDLRILGDLVHIGDNAEDQARFVEDCSPLGLVLSGEDPVQDRDQLPRMRLARCRGGKPRIIKHARLQAILEFLPAPFIGGNRQQQTASVAAAVVDPERIEPALARRLRHDFLAAQRALY